MKSSNLLLLLILLAGVSCVKKTPVTLLSRFEKKAEDHPFAVRKLASSGQGQCLIDIFNVETLKEEVQELEKQYSGGQKVYGTWKHLDLSRLPVPQANFLKTYGNQIGDLRDPESIDYSSCDDLPCIFNKIYGREDSQAGYVHYIWYLKFGHMLSLDNRVPEQVSKVPGEYNGKAIPLSSYLYDNKELYGLWRLSQLLKSPHTTLKYLKEIQRIPRGEKFEGNYGNACGLAYSTGSINLTDGCLTIYNNPDTGYLYQAITHELSHHIDFEQGRGTRIFYRSQKQDYLDLAGMYMNEFVDESGVLTRQWKQKPDIKLVSSYAGTSPQENFAESIAIFRIDGDLTKKNITNDHFNFVSQDYYQGRSFEKEELIKSWINNSASEAGKDIFKAVLDCSKDPGTRKSTYFVAKDFSSPILPAMLNCISSRASDISSLIRGKSALYEPDGCRVLNDNSVKGKWEAHMKVFLKASFETYLNELKKDKQYIARIQEYFNQLSDKTIAKASYINCFQERNEESCYTQEVHRNAYEKALSLKLPEEQTKEMADMYVSYHPFNTIKDETLKSYQVFVSSNLDSIAASSREVWDGCKKISHDDEQSPTGSLFQTGSDYMISSFYNCLNLNIPEAVKTTVRNISVDNQRVQHAKEELILSQEVLPLIVKHLKEIYPEEKLQEIIEAQEFIASDSGNVRRLLLGDFSWVSNVVDEKQIMSDCKKEGVRFVSYKPLFNLKYELFSAYVEQNSCPNISGSQEFKNWIESSQEMFREKIAIGLEDQLVALANTRADECIDMYPMYNIINKVRYKKQREACLVNDWPRIENEVLVNAMKDPMVIKFKMTTQDVRSKLEISRRRLQLRLIKERFN